MQTLTITRPDDWHLHVRDDAALSAVIADTARRFGRAIIMPNLRPPVTTVALAAAYRERILVALKNGEPPRDEPMPSPREGGVEGVGEVGSFTPLMTLYLTDNTPPEEIDRVKESGFVHALKLYPAGATTNSDAGVTSLAKCRATIARMEKLGVPLLVHGEVTDPEIDVFDREAVFIDKIMMPLLKDHPALRVVFEHITTKNAAEFVAAAGPNIGATITAHHLLLNRNALFQGGMRPHNYCLPVLKREVHRQALVAAATSGSANFFLGTDSAPHAQSAKESACGCAGCYTANAGIELYAEAFALAGKIDKLEQFASFNGPDFYRLPRNPDTITLRAEAWTVPASQPYLEADPLVPFRAGESIAWQLVSEA